MDFRTLLIGSSDFVQMQYLVDGCVKAKEKDRVQQNQTEPSMIPPKSLKVRDFPGIAQQADTKGLLSRQPVITSSFSFALLFLVVF